ncbi:hypothetical protein B0H11DRAFT_2427747 [Mycena galericulata]|nr:hypothetical protein B0H11DRAFT_2427747 [Mycena galericulata]
MLRRLREHASTPATPGPSESPGPSGDDNMDQDQDTNPPPPHSAFNFAPQIPSLTAFGNLVKRQVTLSDKSTNRSPEERSVLLLAHVLELLDLARKNEKAELWVITPTLSKKINSYTQAFMYSPTITAYRGLSMAEHLLKAMRDSNLAELPAEEETSHCEMTAVKESLETDSDTENIAALADKLLRGTKVKATVQFYIRLAFIRFVMTDYPWLTEETFWLQVDELIQKYRKECETEEELDAFYNFIYQKDLSDHRDPADTVHKTTEFNASGNSWQAYVRKNSANVRPNPKNPTILAAAYKAYNDTQAKASNKRRRLNEEGDDDASSVGGGSIGGSIGGNADERE